MIDWKTLGIMTGIMATVGGVAISYIRKVIYADMSKEFVSIDKCKIMHSNSNGELQEFKQSVKEDFVELRTDIKDLRTEIKSISTSINNLSTLIARIGARMVDKQ